MKKWQKTKLVPNIRHRYKKGLAEFHRLWRFVALISSFRNTLTWPAF